MLGKPRALWLGAATLSSPAPGYVAGRLATEAVESLALALEGVDDVHGGDSLPIGVLGVGDRVTDHVLQEDLQDAAGFLVDQAGDPLDTAPPGQAPNGRLGDPLDVVGENLAMPLDSTLAQSLATCSHDRNESSRLSAFNQEQEQFDSPSLL